MKKIIVVLLLFISTPSFAKVYIDINGSGNQSFPIAINRLFIKANDPLMRRAESDFNDTLKKDLQLMSVFSIIPEKSILEPADKRDTLDASKIDFQSWKVIEALAFTKGVLSGTPDKMVLELYLYDTLAKKEIVAKRYTGAEDQVRKIAHAFGNTIVESLLGEKGVFDTRIAFICRPEKFKELCLMDFNGENNRVLTNHKTIVLSPAWNPNNGSIYYTAFDKKDKPQLFLFDLNSYTSKSISDFPGMTIGLSFDPHDKLLVTSLTKDDNAEIYLLDNFGKIVRRVTNNKNIDVSASFSPDGKEIVFVSDREGTSQIYKMSRDGDGARAKRLTFKGRNNTSPSWSPKGDKILFAGMDTDGEFDIFSMNTDGSGMNRLTYDTRNNEEPTWSPDGNLIAFASNRKTKDNQDSKSQIYIMRPDGSRQTQITSDHYDHTMPSWESR